MIQNLEIQGNTGSANNTGLDVVLAQKSVLVAQLASRQSARQSCVLAGTEIVTALEGETGISAVQRILGPNPDVRFDENLSTIASVDTVGNVVVVRVVDVASTETDGWTAGVEVLQVVVGVGDVEVTGIFGLVAVRVADEGCLPMVVDVGVGEGDVFRGVGYVEETIVVVFIVVSVGREIHVVNPDVAG